MFDHNEAWERLTHNGEDIVICTHHNPDGDAVGSAVALAGALNLAGLRPVVLLDEHADKFNYFRNRFVFNGSDTSVLPCDVLVAVDCGDFSRVARAEGLFERAKVTVSIDHHINNGNFADFNYIDTASASCAEVIFNIVCDNVPIERDMAEALYMGIVTDTGCFRFSSTTPATLEIAAALMRIGIDFPGIQHRVVHSRSPVEMSIFATALKNIKYVSNGRIAYTSLTQAELLGGCADYKDLDGITEYLMNIEGVEAAIFFTQRRPHTRTKASLRSKYIDVNAIANKFGGGGHKNAAAAAFDATLEEGIELVLKAVVESVG